MSKKSTTLIVSLLFAIATILANSLYVIDQRQMALVIQLGNVIAVERTPGLKLRLPFIQHVVFFDNRIQNINFKANDSNEVVTADQKTMKLEAFAKYRLIDPLKFHQAVQSEWAFKARMSSIFESTIREIAGTAPFIDILGGKRERIMSRIAAVIAEQGKELGIEVVDMRITRIGLPEKARMSVYKRMETDRSKEAAEIRAQGKQEAEIIRAQTQKEGVMLLAEAEKRSSIIKGEGDATAAEIMIKATKEDEKFYHYYRSLQAYNNVFGKDSSGDTTMLLDMEKNPFFSVMKGGAGAEK